MKDSNLKLAQQDIDEALRTVEDMQDCLSGKAVEKTVLKEKFMSLSERVQQLEDLLKSEGIL